MTKNLRKEERKIQIKKVVIKLMRERGYKNTSVQDILDEINYSKSGFYHCYPSKEELFKEIFKDSMELRYKQILSLKQSALAKDRKAVLVEALIDKIIDYNDYKKLFAKFSAEIVTDKHFYKLYKKSCDGISLDFIEFCEKEDFNEYKIFVNEEFSVFIVSLMIGVDIFNKYDDEKYRKFLREALTPYFENKIWSKQ